MHSQVSAWAKAGGAIEVPLLPRAASANVRRRQSHRGRRLGRDRRLGTDLGALLGVATGMSRSISNRLRVIGLCVQRAEGAACLGDVDVAAVLDGAWARSICFLLIPIGRHSQRSMTRHSQRGRLARVVSRRGPTGNRRGTLCQCDQRHVHCRPMWYEHAASPPGGESAAKLPRGYPPRASIAGMTARVWPALAKGCARGIAHVGVCQATLEQAHAFPPALARLRDVACAMRDARRRQRARFGWGSEAGDGLGTCVRTIGGNWGSCECAACIPRRRRISHKRAYPAAVLLPPPPQLVPVRHTPSRREALRSKVPYDLDVGAFDLYRPPNRSRRLVREVEALRIGGVDASTVEGAMRAMAIAEAMRRAERNRLAVCSSDGAVERDPGTGTPGGEGSLVGGTVAARS